MLYSVTRLGSFWEFSVTNFLIKVDQIFGNTLGYFENCHLKSKNYFGHFLGHFLLQNLVTLMFIKYFSEDISKI